MEYVPDDPMRFVSSSTVVGAVFVLVDGMVLKMSF